MPNFISNIDLAVAQWVPEHRSDVATLVMHFFTSIANWEFITIACLLLIAFFLYRGYRQHITALIISVAGGELMVFILKRIIERERPLFGLQLDAVEPFSFPSGHSFVAWSFYGLITYFLYQAASSKHEKVLVLLGGTLVIGLIGFSRIYLGVHWTSDVVLTSAAGAVWLAFVITVLGRKRRDILKV